MIHLSSTKETAYVIQRRWKKFTENPLECAHMYSVGRPVGNLILARTIILSICVLVTVNKY